MMKSTLATILGTAALGLIKSKMGSGIRLKTGCYSILEEVINIPSSDENVVLKLIKESEPMMNTKGIFIESLYLFEKYDPREEESKIIIIIKKLVESEQELNRCKIWWSDNEERPEAVEEYDFWWNGETSQELEYFFYSYLMPEIEKITEVLNQQGEETDYGYYKVILNADTGEEYKPATKQSKLRKR